LEYDKERHIVWNMVETNKEGMYPRDKNKHGNNGKDEIET
jgi:hypothetical protein